MGICFFIGSSTQIQGSFSISDTVIITNLYSISMIAKTRFRTQRRFFNLCHCIKTSQLSSPTLFFLHIHFFLLRNGQKKLIVLNEKLGENRQSTKGLIFTYNLPVVHNIFSETNSPTNQMYKYMIAMIARAADKILLFTEIFFLPCFFCCRYWRKNNFHYHSI